MAKSIKNYITPLLLLVFMFASNFLDTNLFDVNSNSFAVWFVLSLLCFAAGYFINKTSGWQFGGKLVFAAIVTATVFGLIVIIFFGEYFNTGKMMTENIILYSLRNIMLGSMGFFGMAIVEIFELKKDKQVLDEKIEVYEKLFPDIKKETELEIREAKLAAQKILNDANAEAKNILLKKERLENELKEFIYTEKELIKKYEELE